ncbi:MAG: HAD-IIIC family phosphatase, partial [Lachnospiraceae bacterium]|nr:HAD-IIIC family phosphatase [Lachnospiraceae bacterium]
MIKDKIKAVFWDLDDTLWQGILAEGENIEIFAERKRIIEQLNHRGIVNSVCSKNEYQTARKKLIEFGCWEMFVFPQIAFQPKGEMIRRTLKDMNLRAENILFIDDNDANLKEVEYYNPGISTLISDAVSEDLLLNPNLQGKPDQNLSRVNQYKVLEKKTSAKKESISNYEFMHSCHIKLWLIPYNDSYFERVYELSDRTNQLNFTKKRMSQDELRDMLSDDQIETMLCRVSDDYGDYGIVGFYSKHNNRLLHYVFSCRIMNMGIE